MFYHIKRRDILYLSSLVILLMIIGFTYGYLTREPAAAQPSPNAETIGKEKDDLPLEEDTDIDTVSKTQADSVLILERFYIRCQHLLEDEMIMNISGIGLARDEILLSYPGWEIAEFTSKVVKLTAEIDGYCPNHFIIKEKDGYLVVYRAEKETGSLYPIETTKIQFKWLSQEMKDEAKIGIVVDTIEEIEHLIENWES